MFGNIEQKMSVVGHDDESEQEERIPILHPVQAFYCLSCTGRIGEDLPAVFGAGGDQHQMLILDGVALEHDGTSLNSDYSTEIIFRSRKSAMVAIFVELQRRSLFRWEEEQAEITFCEALTRGKHSAPLYVCDTSTF